MTAQTIAAGSSHGGETIFVFLSLLNVET